MDKKELFESLPVPVALRKMIVPAAVSQIIVLIYNMADTFYIGRTNNPYMLAGASLILPVFNMLTCLASLAGIGGGTLLSRLLGAGQEEEARRVSAFSFWLGVVLSLAFSLGLGCSMGPALRFLGAGGNIFLYARQYAFCVIVLGAVPTVLSNVMAHLVRSVGMSREAGFGITLGAVLNIALDPVFMYLILPDGQHPAVRTVHPLDCPGLHLGQRYGVAGRHLPAHPHPGHAAHVLKLLHRLHLPGLRQRAHLAVPGRGAVAGVQHPHALPAEFPHRHVRHRLVPDHSRCADGAALGLCLPHPSSRLCGLTASYKSSRPEAAASGRGFLIFSRIRNRGCPVPPR